MQLLLSFASTAAVCALVWLIAALLARHWPSLRRALEGGARPAVAPPPPPLRLRTGSRSAWGAAVSPDLARAA